MATPPKKPKKPTKPSGSAPPPRKPPTKPPTTPPPAKPPAKPNPTPAPVNPAPTPRIPAPAGGVNPWWKVLGIGAGLYGAKDLLDYFNPNKGGTPSPMRPAGGALSPDIGVTPRQPVTPTPQGGEGQRLGDNRITPEQVKENLKNYPNSSGYPWSGLSASGQVLDASGRKQTFGGSYENEYDGAGNVVGQRAMGIGPDGVHDAERMSQDMNQRGRRTAFQQDLDIETQLRDRSSPLFRAMDRMRGGQLTDFRLGNEEGDAEYDAMIAQREAESAQRRGTGIPHPQSARGLARQAQYQAQNPVRGRPHMSQESKDMYAGMIKSMSLEEKKKLFASGKMFPDE